MWVWLSMISALLLGLYDVAKKKALSRNGVLQVLLVSTSFSVLWLLPFLFLRSGSLADHLQLLLKSVLVTLSWISGLVGMKYLPLTTASGMKASRPAFVVLFSVLLFSERLSMAQWAGVLAVLVAMFMLAHSSRKEEIGIRERTRGVSTMVLSIMCGVASALFDKHIMKSMDPLFVQSWGNLYIASLLAIALAVYSVSKKTEGEKIRWDASLVLISVLITASDLCYFFALSDGSALLSVVSLLRRSSVLVTFVCGAILFKEKRIKEKGVWMVLMLAGMVCLVLGS